MHFCRKDFRFDANLRWQQGSREHLEGREGPVGRAATVGEECVNMTTLLQACFRLPILIGEAECQGRKNYIRVATEMGLGTDLRFGWRGTLGSVLLQVILGESRRKMKGGAHPSVCVLVINPLVFAGSVLVGSRVRT